MPTINNFTAGESVNWLLELVDYPASSWAVTYYLRGASSLDVAGVGSGSTFNFSISPSQSAGLAPGLYFYQAFAVKGSTDKKLVDEGQIEVKQSLVSAAAGFDGRSYAVKTLEAITKALNGVAADGVQGYVIQSPQGSREIRNMTLPDLMEAHKYFSGIVAQERRQKNGEGIIGTEFYTFTRPQ